MAFGNVINPLGGQAPSPQSAANVGGASQNVPAMKQNNPAPLSGFRPPRFWLIFGGLAALVLILIFVLSFFVLNKKPSPDVSQSPKTAEKVLEQSPVALPAIKENTQEANPLKDYFKSVSSNFQDSFMTNVPEIAANAYKKYLDAPEGEEKLEAARAFYIYLNNPGVLKDDPSYNQFLTDVKGDLENTLKRNLFGE